MKIAFVKQGGKLIPCGNSDYDKWNKLPEGEIHECEIKKNRNLLHHRKLWAILKTVCSNSDKWQVPDQLLAALKIKLGYYNIVNGFDDSTLMVLGSIRFEVMGQDKFKIFYDAALQLISKELGCTIDELERNSQEEL